MEYVPVQETTTTIWWTVLLLAISTGFMLAALIDGIISRHTNLGVWGSVGPAILITVLLTPIFGWMAENKTYHHSENFYALVVEEAEEHGIKVLQSTYQEKDIREVDGDFPDVAATFEGLIGNETLNCVVYNNKAVGFRIYCAL